MITTSPITPLFGPMFWERKKAAENPMSTCGPISPLKGAFRLTATRPSGAQTPVTRKNTLRLAELKQSVLELLADSRLDTPARLTAALAGLVRRGGSRPGLRDELVEVFASGRSLSGDELRALLPHRRSSDIFRVAHQLARDGRLEHVPGPAGLRWKKKQKTP